jgi:hypothetical protein
VHPALWALTTTPDGELCSCLLACLKHPADATQLQGTCAHCTQCVASYAHAVSCSAQQAQTYFLQYARVARLPHDTQAALAAAHATVEGTAESVSNSSTNGALSHAQAALAYHAVAADAARTQWTQFRPGRIFGGLALLAIALVATGALTGAAVHYRNYSFAVTSRIVRAFFLEPPVPWPRVLSISRPVAICLGLVVVRAAVPFSNSLILGELQVTAFLVATGVLVAAAAALSRIAAVHQRVEERCYTATNGGTSAERKLPMYRTPAAAFRWLMVLVTEALVPLQRSAQRRRSSNGSRYAAELPNGSAADVQEPEAIDRRRKRMRLSPYLVASSSLLTGLTAHWLGVRVIYSGLAAAALFFLMRFHWNIKDVARRATGHTLQTAGLVDTSRAALRTLALAAAALIACVVLSATGGIDRIGANPFDKANASAATAGTGTPAAQPSEVRVSPWLVAAPAVAVCSIVAMQLDKAARRIVAMPGAAYAYGVHVPWRNKLGDWLLHTRASGGLVAALMPTNRLLLMLLDLDADDELAAEAEARDHHMPEGVRASG